MSMRKRECVRVEKDRRKGGSCEAAGVRVNRTSEDAQLTRTEDQITRDRRPLLVESVETAGRLVESIIEVTPVTLPTRTEASASSYGIAQYSGGT